MAAANITVVGSLIVDHILFTDRQPDRGECYEAKGYHTSLGGKGANAAIAAYRSCHCKPSAELGNVIDEGPERKDIHVRMVGVVGQDSYAPRFTENLKQNGVDTSGVRVSQDPNQFTGLNFCTVLEDEQDNRMLYALGANAELAPEDFKDLQAFGDELPDLIISQLEIRMETFEQMIDTAGRARIAFLLNAAPAEHVLRDIYPFITHLVVNQSEAAILSGFELEEVVEENWQIIAQAFLDEGVKNVVITLGADGAYFANDESSGHVHGFKVETVDPTGAGDTFVGTYAAEYVRQMKVSKSWSIEEAVVRACKAGAMLVRKKGCQEGIPWADEIDAFGHDHPDFSKDEVVVAMEVVAINEQPA